MSPRAPARCTWPCTNTRWRCRGTAAPGSAQWDRDIATPAANKAHWDPITRTYLFKLGLDDPKLAASGAEYVLTATMVFPNGTQLQADLPLTVK